MIVDLPSVAEAAPMWRDVPETEWVVRTSAQQFAVHDTGNLDHRERLFTKGVLISWLDPTYGWLVGMVFSSMYDPTYYTTGGIGVNVVGPTVNVGASNFKICKQLAIRMAMPIIPGGLTAGIDPTGAYEYAPYDIYPLSNDVYQGTVGSPENTTGYLSYTFDGFENDFTDFTVYSGYLTSLNNVACGWWDDSTGSWVYNSSANIIIDAGAPLGVTIQTAGTTVAPNDLYPYLWYMPVVWRYMP